MSDTSRIDKVIEIVRRQHDNISDEYMIDILAIADQAAAELTRLEEQIELNLLDKVSLMQVDEILSRRPALYGCKTRYEKIERCISAAKQADQLCTNLDEAKKIIVDARRWNDEELQCGKGAWDKDSEFELDIDAFLERMKEKTNGKNN